MVFGDPCRWPVNHIHPLGPRAGLAVIQKGRPGRPAADPLPGSHRGSGGGARVPRPVRDADLHGADARVHPRRGVPRGRGQRHVRAPEGGAGHRQGHPKPRGGRRQPRRRRGHHRLLALHRPGGALGGPRVEHRAGAPQPRLWRRGRRLRGAAPQRDRPLAQAVAAELCDLRRRAAAHGLLRAVPLQGSRRDGVPRHGPRRDDRLGGRLAAPPQRGPQHALCA
mmetsp:Transcript_17332/g.41393  ORF Transcript_17332/g.41393 Transcript_17332/m.41393 type:complete len:223 (+) Transcript_17332:665-1333(+)